MGAYSLMTPEHIFRARMVLFMASFERIFSFIMPSGNANVTVTDTRNDLEKVQDLLTFAGYNTNQGLFHKEVDLYNPPLSWFRLPYCAAP